MLQEMTFCDNCRIARATFKTEEERDAARRELILIGREIVREGRTRNFEYFVEWAISEDVGGRVDGEQR